MRSRARAATCPASRSRALTLKLSGDVTCDMHYYAELEFGHSGNWFDNDNLDDSDGAVNFFENWIGDINTKEAFLFGGDNFGIAREAWIEYEAAPAFAVRMGLIKTAATRQLMTPPEMQQFVDISMASAVIGQHMPGYSDRNRDYGLMVHGALGCDGEWQYMVDDFQRRRPDPSQRDRRPHRRPARLQRAAQLGHQGPHGLRRGRSEAARLRLVGLGGRLGPLLRRPLGRELPHALRRPYDVRLDGAFGWGGFSFTAAYNMWDHDSNDVSSFDEGSSWFAQLGYLFPDSAWEIAARYGMYSTDHTNDFQCGAIEYGAAVNYYIDGHADKLTWDASFISPDGDEDFNEFGDVYAGYSPTFESDGMLIRFQWQLAL